MRCPSCDDQTLLEAEDLSGRRSAYCRQCRGRWCGLDEAVLSGAVIGDAPPLSMVSIAVCPACARRSLSPVLSAEAVGVRPLQCTACRNVWIPGRMPERTPASGGGPLQVDASVVWVASPPPVVTRAQMLRTIALPPAVALVMWALVHVPITRLLIEVLLRMPTHELGHACAGWLSGYVSIPLPFITPSIPSAWVSAPLAIAAIAWMFWRGMRHPLPYWAAIAALAALMGLVNGVFANEHERSLWLSFSGCGGEFVLGALLAMAYYHRVSSRPERDRWRVLFALLGLAVYLNALALWWGVAKGTQPFPYGSALGMEGDMDALVAAGATEAGIIARYLRLAGVCGLVLVAHWAWAARGVCLRWRAGQPGRARRR